ncbi:hypothetical protein KKE06_05920 [Candidatus Micrarchaeota archaeon]|nr:hypothetical protein [Candidatus Micrarchaeota archaeon]
MDIVFKNGPWNPFFEGQSGQHETQLLFDGQSTVLSLVWEIKGNETIGVALEWLRVFVANKNPSTLFEKTGFDCLEIAKKESGEIHWFVLIKSTPSYAPLDQDKIDQEMDGAYFRIHGTEKKLLALAKTLDLGLTTIEDSSENEKSVFFGSPIIHKMLSHKLVHEKQKMETPQEFVSQTVVPHGEFLLGLDKQKQLIKEPFGLFRRTLIVEGETNDRLHAMHIMIESALLSSIPSIVFDDQDFFEGTHRPTTDATQLKKANINLEPIGFPLASFSVPSNVRISLSTIDIDAILELFRAGKTPAIQTVQSILSTNQATNLSQLIEAIQVQIPSGETTAYQLKKAVRIVMLIEKTYPGFFNGPNDMKELSKSWGSGFGRVGLLSLNGLDERIKTILFHSLLREFIQYYKSIKENRPVKAMIFLPETSFLFPRHPKWRIQKIILDDLREASSVGVGSVISTEKPAEITPQLTGESQSQISIVNQDDIGVRIEHRKPYRVILRPPLSECTEQKNNNDRMPQIETISTTG